jgi:proteasome accessory factor C
MAKKSTPLERAARMLDLVPYLHKHQGISVNELAAEFKVERKELLEDLQALWMCGENKFDYMDLEFESDYVFIRNADTLKAIRTLANPERISLLIGLSLIESEIAEESLRTDITLLRKKLGENLEAQLAASASISAVHVATIEDAIKGRKKLEFSYYSPSDDVKTLRQVDPLFLSVENGSHYLIAYCHTSSAQRTFRLDRISDLTLLHVTTQAQASVDENNSTFAVRIKLHHNLRKNRETLGANVIENEDSFLVHIFSESWIVRTVLAGLGGIELLDPENVRESIHRRAQSIRALYR